MSTGLQSQPDSARLRTALNRRMAGAMLADAHEDIQVALRVGVCAALGMKRAEIADRLELTSAEVRAAMERLKRAAERLGD